MPILSYLKLPIPEANREKFVKDFEALWELARQQPGFIRAEHLRTTEGREAYVVISEWETVEHIRAWEREAAHKAVIDSYTAEQIHRRYVPWQRPTP